MQTIFVSMIGLEERVMGVFQKGEAVADEYLLFVNKEFEDDPRVNTYRSEILDKYLVGKQFKLMRASYYDPFIIVKEFNRLKSEEPPDFQEGKIKVTLDISTFNRQNLLVMLFLLRRILKVSDIEVIYTVPKQVNQEISRGAAGFSNIPFFGGTHSIEKKRLLMLLAGYEIDRPLLLWRELQPSKVILAEGVEPTDKSFYEKNKEAVAELSKVSSAEVTQISAKDPARAKVQLSDIFNKEKKEFNIFASPLNTKLQAVGLYLAWEENPEVQIVVSFPDKFSDWLTKDVKEVKRYKI